MTSRRKSADKSPQLDSWLVLFSLSRGPPLSPTYGTLPLKHFGVLQINNVLLLAWVVIVDLCSTVVFSLFMCNPSGCDGVNLILVSPMWVDYSSKKGSCMHSLCFCCVQRCHLDILSFSWDVGVVRQTAEVMSWCFRMQCTCSVAPLTRRDGGNGIWSSSVLVRLSLVFPPHFVLLSSFAWSNFGTHSVVVPWLCAPLLFPVFRKGKPVLVLTLVGCDICPTDKTAIANNSARQQNIN